MGFWELIGDFDGSFGGGWKGFGDSCVCVVGLEEDWEDGGGLGVL